MPTAASRWSRLLRGREDHRPDEWFFSAHFFLDPVMPGSLGWKRCCSWHAGSSSSAPAHSSHDAHPRRTPHSWKYRGQVRRPVKRMTIELEVTALSDTSLVFTPFCAPTGCRSTRSRTSGIDGRGSPNSRTADVPSFPIALARVRRCSTVRRSTGTPAHGALTLDPARFPWLDDHRPTVTVAARPLAFAAEIAAEAAQQLRPEPKVVGLPEASTADAWIHTGDGPTELRWSRPTVRDIGGRQPGGPRRQREVPEAVGTQGPHAGRRPDGSGTGLACSPAMPTRWTPQRSR